MNKSMKAESKMHPVTVWNHNQRWSSFIAENMQSVPGRNKWNFKGSKSGHEKGQC